MNLPKMATPAEIQEATSIVVRTVLGDVDPLTLGATDYHEHLFQASPLLHGDELDDEQQSSEEAKRFHHAGIASMVEATPVGLGRNPEAVARISAQTGLGVVHVTGAHHGGHYPESHPIRALSTEKLAALFSSEVLEGFAVAPGDRTVPKLETPVRAGMLKAGIRYWNIGTFERGVLSAVAVAHRETGAAVMVHLDYGSAAHEVVDILEDQGVPRHRIVLAHIDRNLDAGLHADLISSGVYLGYDGPARHRESSDEAILDCLSRVVAEVGAERILLGGDVARRSRYLAYGGMPGLEYLPRRFVPRLLKAVGEEAAEAILTTNPARLLAFAPGSSTSSA